MSEQVTDVAEMATTLTELHEVAFNLISALDLPHDTPEHAAARLKELSKDESSLTELVVATVACERVVMGYEKKEAPWRNSKLKPNEKWRAVCFSFPSLESHPLVREAIAEAKLRDLEQLGRREDTGNACKNAIRFVLALWNPGFAWECGKFEIVPALKAWDESHVAAFRAWVADPWWP